MKNFRKLHVLFVAEDNQVPRDTRVFQEAKALAEKGLEISIICPNLNRENKHHKKLDNIEVFQYTCLFEGKSFTGIIVEYLIAIFLILFNAIRIYLRKPFHIVHLANPPDFLILLFLPFKLLGIKIIFDHHDLSPELFAQKFQKDNLFYKLLLLFEKISYKLANIIITTNNSIKKTCTQRNKVCGEKIFVVRNGPDLNEIDLSNTKENFKEKRNYLIGYIGKIDKQDSLEKLIGSIDYMVNEKKFRNFKVLIIGDGTDRKRIENIVKERALKEYFIFYGPAYNRKKIFSLLSKIDIGVEPSKETEKFTKSTSTKVMEYMAVGKPIVQYNTIEGKLTAGDASLFIQKNNERAFGDAMIQLLKNTEKRKKMGTYGKNRVKELLQWDIQKRELLRVYLKHLLK